MSSSACRFSLLPCLPYPINSGPVFFAVHLNLGWTDLRVHDVFDSPPNIPLGLRKFLQPKILLMNLKLDLCCAKPLPPRRARKDQPQNLLE